MAVHPGAGATYIGRASGGEQVRLRPPAPVPSSIEAEAIPLDVLYEDADLVVLNKAPGMTVHPGAGATYIGRASGG